MSWIHTGYTQRIHFGVGVMDQAGEVCDELRLTRLLVVTTAGRRASPEGGRLLEVLGPRVAGVFDGVRSHVPTSVVDAAAAAAQAAGVDGVVSFGGGSCADLGKAVCWRAEQADEAGTARTYAERPALCHLAIPTAYSGAELTPFFGMTDEAARRKTGAGGPTLAPLAALYDPAATLSTPPRVSAETGMNAMAHGVECAYSPTRTPEAEAVALACIERVAAALPAVVDDPDDLDARTVMLEGAVLGGRCLQNAGMGVHHGLSQLMGARSGLPHGLVNAIVLPHAMRFNAGAVGDVARRIGVALGDPDDPAGALDRLRASLGLPATLGECGVGADDVEAVALGSPDNRNVAANVRPVSVDDARSILTAALGAI